MLLSSLLTFVPGGPATLPVDIVLNDDEFFEGREEFSLGLQPRQPRVVVSAESATVAIVDNEGACVY